MDLATTLDTSLRSAGARPGDAVGLAVSGGGDSMALLEAAASSPSFRWHVLHVDHGMRAGSADDAAFVRRAAAERGVRWSILRPASGVRPSGSPEEAARSVRYALLERAAQALGCRRVATAHTLDDQAETVLMRLIRGTGTRGLAGIPAARAPFVRPFLGVSGGDVRSWLAARGASWANDPTNADLRYDRNWVRHHLLPAIADRHPSAPANLARAAGLAAEDDAYLDDLAADLRARVWCDAYGFRLPLDVLDAPRPLHARVVRDVLVEAGARGDAREVERVRALAGGAEGVRVTLGGGVDAWRLGASLVLRPPRAQAPAPEDLPEDGTACLDAWRVRLRVSPTDDVPPWRWRYVVGSGPMRVRARRPGDRVRTHAGTRKVSDLLVDAKVPAVLRDLMPVLEVDGEPAAVVGLPRPSVPVGLASDGRVRVVDAEPLDGGWWEEPGPWTIAKPGTTRARASVPTGVPPARAGGTGP